MLVKARHYAPHEHLINIYHAIFASHMMYGAQVWTPKLISVSDTVSQIQKSAMRIITFSEFKAHHEPLCKQLGILKFVDNIEVSNCIFVYDFLKKHYLYPISTHFPESKIRTQPVPPDRLVQD